MSHTIARPHGSKYSRYGCGLIAAICGGVSSLIAADSGSAWEPADRLVPIYAPTEIASFKLVDPKLSAARKALIEAFDWKGEAKHRAMRMLETDSEGTQILKIESFGPGWFLAKVKLLSADDVVVGDTEIRLVSGPLRKSEGETFRYAISAHPYKANPRELEKELAMISGLGVDMLREEPLWRRVADGPGKWRYEHFDELLHRVRALGVEMSLILAYAVPWSTDGNPKGDWQNYAPQMEPWLEYVRTTVLRYRDQVRYWEIWNEPDIGFWRSPPSVYAELFNRTAKLIKEVDPHSAVLNGGFALVKRPPNLDFIEQFLQKAETANWDIRAYHDYATLADMIQHASQHRELYRGHPLVGAPVWMTEGGYTPLVLAGGEDMQAITLVKKFATAPAVGLAAYFWYDLRDDGRDPKNKEHRYGISTYEYQPRPAYAAFRRLIWELADRPYQSSIFDQPAGFFAHLYGHRKDDDENIIVVWNETTGVEQPMWLELPEAAEFSGASDMMGAPVLVDVHLGGVVTTVSSTPIYIRTRGVTKMPKITPMLEVPPVIPLMPNRPHSLSIPLRNPLRETISPKIVWKTDEEQSLQIKTTSIDVLSPESESVVRLDIAQNESSATSGQIRGVYRTSPVGTGIDVAIPYDVAHSIPGIGNEGSPLSFKLLERRFIRNLYEALVRPEMDWHGTDDLSAEASIACSEDFLQLSIKVTDDRQQNTSVAPELWRHDSVMLAFAPAGQDLAYAEFAFGLGPEGTELGWVNRAPPDGPVKQATPTDGQYCKITRELNITTYLIRIPWKDAGLGEATRNGLRLSFIINDDDDGKGRKQWLELTGGLGERKEPSKFLLFVR